MQSSRQGHTLLLAAAQFGRPTRLESFELDHGEHFRDSRPDLGSRTPFERECEADVLRDAHVRKQRIVLKHHADAPLLWSGVSDRPSLENDLAGVRVHIAGDRPQ
jgi:hypothetical protein